MLSRAFIVTYHAIEPGPLPLCMHPDLFRVHLDVLTSSGVRTVTVSELVSELISPTGDERLVALTFDDGFASVAQCAAPLLLERGLTATVFCVAGHVGGLNNWDSGPAGGFASPLASPEQVRGLADAGFEIGSHGFAHLPAAEVSGTELEQELLGSREALERLTGRSVGSYAYPYGSLPSREGRKLVEQTYAAACTTRVSLVGQRPDVHALPRVDAYYVRRPELMARALAGSLGPYLAARRLGSRARRAWRKDYVTA